MKSGACSAVAFGLWMMSAESAFAQEPLSTPSIEWSHYPSNNNLDDALENFSEKWPTAFLSTQSLPPNSVVDLPAVFKTLADKIVHHVNNQCTKERKKDNHDPDFTRLLFEALMNQMTPEDFMAGVDEVLVLNRNKIKMGETRWEQTIFIKHHFSKVNGGIGISPNGEQSWSIFNFKQAGKFGRDGDYLLTSGGTHFYTDRVPTGLSAREKAKLAAEIQKLNSEVTNANKVYGKDQAITVIRTIKDRLKQSSVARASTDYEPFPGLRNGGGSGCNNPQAQPVTVEVQAPVMDSQTSLSFVGDQKQEIFITGTAGLVLGITALLLGGMTGFRSRTA